MSAADCLLLPLAGAAPPNISHPGTVLYRPIPALGISYQPNWFQTGPWGIIPAYGVSYQLLGYPILPKPEQNMHIYTLGYSIPIPNLSIHKL